MRLIMKIPMSKIQNQTKRQRHRECETESEPDNGDDSNTDIDFIKKIPSHLRE